MKSLSCEPYRHHHHMPDTRLYVAVDTPDESGAVALATSLASLSGLGIKLGLEFFGALGPAGIRAVRAAAPTTPIFLDLKFHDIPNTVAGVVRSVLPLGPTLITLHASGGMAMMKAAVCACLLPVCMQGCICENHGVMMVSPGSNRRSRRLPMALRSVGSLDPSCWR